MLSTLEAAASLWGVFVLVALNAALTGVEAPARTSMIPALVSPSQLPSAFALNQTLQQTMQVAGPAVAGVLMARMGIGAAYWLAALAGALTAFALTGAPSRWALTC